MSSQNRFGGPFGARSMLGIGPGATANFQGKRRPDPSLLGTGGAITVPGTGGVYNPQAMQTYTTRHQHDYDDDNTFDGASTVGGQSTFGPYNPAAQQNPGSAFGPGQDDADDYGDSDPGGGIGDFPQRLLIIRRTRRGAKDRSEGARRSRRTESRGRGGSRGRSKSRSRGRSRARGSRSRSRSRVSRVSRVRRDSKERGSSRNVRPAGSRTRRVRRRRVRRAYDATGAEDDSYSYADDTGFFAPQPVYRYPQGSYYGSGYGQPRSYYPGSYPAPQPFFQQQEEPEDDLLDQLEELDNDPDAGFEVEEVIVVKAPAGYGSGGRRNAGGNIGYPGAAPARITYGGGAQFGNAYRGSAPAVSNAIGWY